jgi:isoleucyl-tRNA synthetase
MIVNELIEPMRREKIIGSSLEAAVTTTADAGDVDLAELFIVSSVAQGQGTKVSRTTDQKCGRCWRHLPEVVEDGALCARCAEVVGCLEATS